MRHLLPLPFIVVIAACGMKGDLYEVPPPEPAGTTEPETTPGDADPDGRKTIPATPDPARSQ